MADLDIRKLPKVETSLPLLRRDIFEEYPKLQNLGDISERIFGCYFLLGVSLSPGYEDYSWKTKIRSAINEMISISEICKKAFPKLPIENTDIPLLHFIKELRVTNFHIKSFTSSNIDGQFAIVGRDGGISGNHEMKSYGINNCNHSLFSKNNNFKKQYDTPEFHQTIEWVANAQKIWGLSHVIELGLRQYCDLLMQGIYG